MSCTRVCTRTQDSGLRKITSFRVLNFTVTEQDLGFLVTLAVRVSGRSLGMRCVQLCQPRNQAKLTEGTTPCTSALGKWLKPLGHKGAQALVVSLYLMLLRIHGLSLCCKARTSGYGLKSFELEDYIGLGLGYNLSRLFRVSS